MGGIPVAHRAQWVLEIIHSRPRRGAMRKHGFRYIFHFKNMVMHVRTILQTLQRVLIFSRRELPHYTDGRPEPDAARGVRRREWK